MRSGCVFSLPDGDGNGAWVGGCCVDHGEVNTRFHSSSAGRLISGNGFMRMARVKRMDDINASPSL